MAIGGIANSLGIAAMLAGPFASIKVDFPPELTQAFQNADQSLSKVAFCLGEKASYNSDELDARDRRLIKVKLPASRIWGWESVRTADDLDAPPDVDCNARQIPSLLVESDAALDALEASFAKHSATFDKGVWIGNLSLCGVGRITTKMTDDEFIDNNALLITLHDAAAAELAVITEANVGHPLAIRANGAIVMEPQINEPLIGGQFQITNTERTELEKVSVLLAQCAGVP